MKTSRLGDLFRDTCCRGGTYAKREFVQIIRQVVVSHPPWWHNAAVKKSAAARRYHESIDVRKLRHWFLRLLLVLLGAMLAAGLIRWQLTLSFLGRYLVCSLPPQSADVILVLAGDFYGPRILKAAELAKQGYAPVVVVSGGPYGRGMEGDYAIAFLATRGYSPHLFESFGHHARSTIEEAIALRGELRRRHVKRVILVTSDFHSRRSSIVFRLFCPGIDFISVPGLEPDFHADRWWMDPHSKALFYSEWTKIFGTVLVAYPKDLIRRLFGN